MSKATEDLMAILAERGSQYGHPDDDKANLRESARLGVDPVTGVLVRMGDKWSRIVSLSAAARRGEIIDVHQLRDQLVDMAGYSVKAMELLDELFAAYGDHSPDHIGSHDPETGPSIGRWLRSVLGDQRGPESQ